MKVGNEIPDADRKPQILRWWQYKRTWLIGLPLLLAIGIAGLFFWGSLQARPAGFEPVVPNATAVTEETVATIEEDEAVPIEEDEAVPIVEEEAVAAEEEWTRYTLDAASYDDWVLFDFIEGTVIEGDFSAPGWDVAFRRTELLTNSGVTNPDGPGGAFDLGEVPLELASPPESVVFAVDSLGGEDDDEPENTAAGSWYSYSFITHIVSVKPNTYLVRTGESLDALVQFDSYYCEDEESGCVTFRYRLIPEVADATS
jgi:hypothetical protein